MDISIELNGMTCCEDIIGYAYKVEELHSNTDNALIKIKPVLEGRSITLDKGGIQDLIDILELFKSRMPYAVH